MARSGATVSRMHQSLGDALDPRSNSLNLIRLLLAVIVVVSHGMTLGGYGSELILGHTTTFGSLAVFCFFGISGYLSRPGRCPEASNGSRLSGR